MSRYFIEVSYKGSAFSGFQRQENAHTVQEELERALAIVQREPVLLTGSSRTDTGVHARQNFFHCDFEGSWHPQLSYKLNAIISPDLVVKRIMRMQEGAHCRFDASSRLYHYYVYRSKDPFLRDRAYYFPYTLNRALMDEAAAMLLEYRDFSSFSKRNTQVKNFLCHIMESEWQEREGCLLYRVRANRFLRGMVRALTATMLKLGRGKLSLEEFRAIIEAKDSRQAQFAVPGHGLFLEEVAFPYPLPGAE